VNITHILSLTSCKKLQRYGKKILVLLGATFVQNLGSKIKCSSRVLLNLFVHKASRTKRSVLACTKIHGDFSVLQTSKLDETELLCIQLRLLNQGASQNISSRSLYQRFMPLYRLSLHVTRCQSFEVNPRDNNENTECITKNTGELTFTCPLDRTDKLAATHAKHACGCLVFCTPD
jgi:hypothetical protein